MSATDERTTTDLHCTGCGYGIVARPRLPERCPICGGARWAKRAPLALPDAAAAFETNELPRRSQIAAISEASSSMVGAVDTPAHKPVRTTKAGADG